MVEYGCTRIYAVLCSILLIFAVSVRVAFNYLILLLSKILTPGGHYCPFWPLLTDFRHYLLFLDIIGLFLRESSLFQALVPKIGNRRNS